MKFYNSKFLITLNIHNSKNMTLFVVLACNSII